MGKASNECENVSK